MVLHVVERALAAPSVSRAVVATDDERILEAVRTAGHEALSPSKIEEVAKCSLAQRFTKSGFVGPAYVCGRLLTVEAGQEKELALVETVNRASTCVAHLVAAALVRCRLG